MTMVPNIYLLFAARVMQGLAIGAISSIAPLYIREFVPVELSGSLCPWNQIGIVMGVTFPFVIAFILDTGLHIQGYWRGVYGFPLIVCAFQIYNLRFRYRFETPKYLLLQNQE